MNAPDAPAAVLAAIDALRVAQRAALAYHEAAGRVAPEDAWIAAACPNCYGNGPDCPPAAGACPRPGAVDEARALAAERYGAACRALAAVVAP